MLVGGTIGLGVSLGFFCLALFALNSWIPSLAFFCLSIFWTYFSSEENTRVRAFANAAGMCGVGVGLAAFALWMMFAPSMRLARASSAHPPAAVSKH